MFKLGSAWVVFDFGGGTFDSALMEVEEGVIQVIDTEGDNQLGGKNLDDSIIDKILIPELKQKFALEQILGDTTLKSLLRDALKEVAENIKIAFSNKGVEVIISNICCCWKSDPVWDSCVENKPSQVKMCVYCVCVMGV